jgi:hypothetical protein
MTGSLPGCGSEDRGVGRFESYLGDKHSTQNAMQQKAATSYIHIYTSLFFNTKTTFKYISAISANYSILWPHSFTRGRRQGH